jgi:hypothetical protein
LSRTTRRAEEEERVYLFLSKILRRRREFNQRS